MGPADPMDPAPRPTSTELLGLAPDARALLLNADDFGMYPAVNSAVVESIENGIAASCSLMVPCPAAAQALELLRERPHIPFGVHLTLVRDLPRLPWGPLSPKERVPSLLDGAGELYDPAGIPELLARARPAEVEREFRAQIDAVLDAGLAPVHLDWHCLADGGREDIRDLTLTLAAEYGLAARIWREPARRALRRRGLPALDHPFLDSFALGLDDKAAHYAQLLRELPPGLTEWAVHPGLDDAHARAVDPGGWQIRSTDHAFLTSPQARDILREEGIAVVDYQALRRIWTAAG
ncbi:polysaccharide deacetylase family protein [Streptomyces sp. NPDC005962]|uniref:polysaccharide deacetylase family protein n=1 Tax=Streptomyces sp. NPDC005962 TaxID=3154466 RepID=UPI0033DCC6D1